LILAIENQLGLKSFAGAPEDHLDRAYAGIESRYSEHSPITFGNRDLRRLIASAGWTRQQFLYPFPDYKFPNVVVGAEVLEDDPDLASAVLRFTPGTDPAQSYYPAFSEEEAWPNAVRNGLAQGLANSFLVLASDGYGQFTRCPLQIFSTRRKRAFAKVTIIDPAQPAAVRRTALYPEARDDSGDVYQRLADEPLIRGTMLAERFCDLLNRPGWTARELASCCEPWIGYVRSECREQSELDPYLPGDLLDCIPWNLIQDETGVLHRFDQEWISRSPIPLSRVVVRGIFDVLLRLRSVALRGDSSSDSIFDLVVECLDLLGLTPAREKVDAAVEGEVSFQTQVSQRPRSLTLYRESRLRVVRRPQLLRKFGLLPQSDTESEGSLTAALLEARERADLLGRELAVVKRSRVYRLSRIIAGLFRRAS